MIYLFFTGRCRRKTFTQRNSALLSAYASAVVGCRQFNGQPEGLKSLIVRSIKHLEPARDLRASAGAQLAADLEAWMHGPPNDRRVWIYRSGKSTSGGRALCRGNLEPTRPYDMFELIARKISAAVVGFVAVYIIQRSTAAYVTAYRACRAAHQLRFIRVRMAGGAHL